jgi:MFS transporter, CP family, cyanate transporter
VIALASAPARRRLAPDTAGGGATIVAVVLLLINLRTLFASLPPLLPDVRDDLGLSATAAGLLTTLPVACLGGFAPLAPRLARRVSIERLLVVCGTLTAAGAGLRGVGGTAVLFAGTVLAGAAIAVAQAVVPVLIRTRFPSRMGALTGAFSMALTMGAAVAAALAVPLQDLFGGSWAAALAVWALPALAAAALWVAPSLRPGTTVTGAPPPPLARVPLAWCVAVFFGIQSMGFYATLAWLPSMLEDEGYASGRAGALLALMTIVQLAPAFAVPLLAARFRDQRALLVAIAGLSVGGLAGLVAAPQLAGLWVVVLGVGQGGALGLGMILPVLRGGDVAAVASLMAMTLCVGYLIAAIGPWLLGAVRDASSGWTAPMIVLIAITACELVVGLPAARARSVRAAA